MLKPSDYAEAWEEHAKAESQTLLPQRATRMLFLMELFRQRHEHDTHNTPHWFISVCRSIVTKAAGLTIYSEWACPILEEMDRFMQAHENEPFNASDWYVRVCQAIVAKAAGYNGRTDWSPLVYDKAAEIYKKRWRFA